MIGVIGDMHFKDNLSYADYIDDRRTAEKKAVLDCIVESFVDCDHIVFLGDNFNSKNNSSETNRAFVEFVERFGDKQIYILGGNHEKRGDGKTAIDFMGEVKKKNWHIITKPTSISFIRKYPAVGMSTVPIFPCVATKMDFLPYMLNSELGITTYEEATKEIMSHLDGGDILFAHHTIGGFMTNGIPTETLKEVILQRKDLEAKYRYVFAGHIHESQTRGRTTLTGSVFTDSVGETEKFVWKINDKFEVTPIKLPCREIRKIENPTAKDLSTIPDSAIVKAVLTDKSVNVEELQEQMNRFDASIIVENYPNIRKKAHNIEGAAFDFSIPALLKLYAEEKGVDYGLLEEGLKLIA